MNIKIQFEQAGTYEISLGVGNMENGNTGAFSEALLAAHIWDMDAWVTKAGHALELYARDRAGDGTNRIVDRCIFQTCDDLAYLQQDIQNLKDNVALILNRDVEMIERMAIVCGDYARMQSFLQPILWVDIPQSMADFSADSCTL